MMNYYRLCHMHPGSWMLGCSSLPLSPCSVAWCFRFTSRTFTRS